MTSQVKHLHQRLEKAYTNSGVVYEALLRCICHRTSSSSLLQACCCLPCCTPLWEATALLPRSIGPCLGSVPKCVSCWLRDSAATCEEEEGEPSSSSESDSESCMLCEPMLRLAFPRWCATCRFLRRPVSDIESEISTLHGSNALSMNLACRHASNDEAFLLLL